MRRFLVLGVALSLLAAACGGDDGAASSIPSTTAATAGPSTTASTVAPATTAAAGFSVSSDDGRVAIDVPADAIGTDPGITVSALAPADAPDDLAALDPPAWAYALEPGALEFDAPVAVTVTIPVEELAGTVPDGATPAVILITTASGGDGWEPLGGQVIRRDGGTVTVTGTTDHFSRLAAVPTQVSVEARFLDVSQDAVATLGFDWVGMGGITLSPPGTGSVSFLPQGTDAEALAATVGDGGATVPCPPMVTSLLGDLRLEALLPALEAAGGDTGAVALPQITGIDTVRTTFEVGLELVCRPTITAEGGVQIDIAVDHPDGEEIIPGEAWGDGLSGMLVVMSAVFPGVVVGLICDVDNDGRIGPADLMYPPVPATTGDGTTTAVLPLYGYGDYFVYVLDGPAPRELQTAVQVRDGAAVVLGGLSAAQTAVPMLGDVPLIGRVFGEESRQSEKAELVVLLTPRILETDD
ncbi:MAG: type II and III secretion system protein [Actinobacteria bacterium]|nr:type II and III secretion system protein [Actinomycetota bacterium]